VTPVGWLQRTPTYKEKRANQPDDVNHGLLTYPVLQAADIALAEGVARSDRQGPGAPPGAEPRDRPRLQRPIRRHLPEPQAVYTEAPTVLGTDGVKKMSKSVGNTIEVLAEPDVIASRSCRWSRHPADHAL